MRKILFAYLFLLLDLELVINIDYFSIVLPIIAVPLLVCGLGEVANENEQFERCVTDSYTFAAVRMILFVLSSLGCLRAEWFYLKLAALVVLILFLGVTQRILRAFREIEQENNLFAASCFCMIGEVCLLILGIGCILANDQSMLHRNFIAISVIGCGLFLLSLYQLQVVYLRFEKAM